MHCILLLLMSSSAIFADNGNGDAYVNSGGDVNAPRSDETKGAVSLVSFPLFFFSLSLIIFLSF